VACYIETWILVISELIDLWRKWRLQEWKQYWTVFTTQWKRLVVWGTTLFCIHNCIGTVSLEVVFGNRAYTGTVQFRMLEFCEDVIWRIVNILLFFSSVFMQSDITCTAEQEVGQRFLWHTLNRLILYVLLLLLFYSHRKIVGVIALMDFYYCLNDTSFLVWSSICVRVFFPSFVRA
jgi:hypothetical protein